MSRTPRSKEQHNPTRVARSSCNKAMGSGMSQSSRQAMTWSSSRATTVEAAAAGVAGAPAADTSAAQQEQQQRKQQQMHLLPQKRKQSHQEAAAAEAPASAEPKTSITCQCRSHAPVDQLHGLQKYADKTEYATATVNSAWDPETFMAAAAAAASSLGIPAHTAAQHSSGNRDSSSSGSSSGGSCSLNSRAASQITQQAGGPTHEASPRLVVLLLAHSMGVTAAEAWQAWVEHQNGKVAVLVHLKHGVSLEGLPGREWIRTRLLPTRIKSEWGDVSLTKAILCGAADVLQKYPGLQHIAVASGQDMPVSKLPSELRPGLSLFGSFQFGLEFDAAAGQVAADLLQQQLGMSQQEAQAWGDALTFYHTWMLLDRQLLLALISKQDEILRVGAVLNERFMHADVAVAADECMLITAAKRYGFVRTTIQKTPQAHVSAVRRQYSKHTAVQRRQPADEVGSSAGANEPPMKQQCIQQRVGFEAVVSCGGPAGAAVRRAAGRGEIMRDDGSVPESTSGGRGSSADTATATAVAGPVMKQRSSRTSKAGGSSGGGSSRSSSDAWAPLFDPNEAACCSAQNSGESNSRASKAVGSSGESFLQQGPCLRRRRAGGLAQGGGTKKVAGLRKGQHIEVEWPEDNAWYPGTIDYFNASVNRYTVRYDDGDVEVLDLAKESYRLLANSTTCTAVDIVSASASGQKDTHSSSSSSSSSIDAAALMQEQNFGVLLDCTPTLALYHPDPGHTRHPHTWCNWRERLLLDVQHNPKKQDDKRYTLLEALGLVKPNAALFMRKVAVMKRCAGHDNPALLLSCLRLLWDDKPLPESLEELKLIAAAS